MISKFVVRSQIVGKKVETRISACKGTEGGYLRLVIPSAARNLLCPERLSKDKIPRCARNDKPEDGMTRSKTMTGSKT
jgi:hypothetical protein